MKDIITNSILTLILLVLQVWILSLPIQNGVGVDQLKDTPTSTSNVTMVSEAYSATPLVTLGLVVFIWRKQIKTVYEKSKNI